MKKELALGIIAVLLVTTPVFAAPGGKSKKAKDNHGMKVAAEKTAERPSAEHVTLPVTVIPPDIQSEVEPLEIREPETETVLEEAEILSPTPITRGKASQIKTIPVSKQVESAVTVAEECDPNAQWKNHGAYVSCVAKTHPGGTVVAEAARSDIGKKATPSATPTEPPATSPETEITVATNPLTNFLKALERLIHSLPLFSNEV